MSRAIRAMKYLALRVAFLKHLIIEQIDTIILREMAAIIINFKNTANTVWGIQKIGRDYYWRIYFYYTHASEINIGQHVISTV